MRLSLILSSLTPPALTLAMMILGRVQLRQFRRVVPAIRGADDLSRLRRLAASQMYAALVALVLLPVPLLVCLHGKFVAGDLGWPAFLLLIAPVFVPAIAAARLGGLVKEVRSIPVADPALQAERDHIVAVWVNRLFPTW